MLYVGEGLHANKPDPFVWTNKICLNQFTGQKLRGLADIACLINKCASFTQDA